MSFVNPNENLFKVINKISNKVLHVTVPHIPKSQVSIKVEYVLLENSSKYNPPYYRLVLTYLGVNTYTAQIVADEEFPDLLPKAVIQLIISAGLLKPEATDTIIPLDTLPEKLPVSFPYETYSLKYEVTNDKEKEPVKQLYTRVTEDEPSPTTIVDTSAKGIEYVPDVKWGPGSVLLVDDIKGPIKGPNNSVWFDGENYFD